MANNSDGQSWTMTSAEHNGAFNTTPIVPGTVGIVSGGNFSGRSRFIAQLKVDFTTRSAKPSVVITPETHLSISGIRFTVADEISLHAGDGRVHESVNQLLELSALVQHLAQNPTTLSGGEQAALAFICKLSLRPQFLGLDCCLEQISPELKDRLLERISGDGIIQSTALALADNRLAESTFRPARSICLPNEAFPLPESILSVPIGRLSPRVANFPPREPHELHLQNLVFGYHRGQPILKNTDARLVSERVHVFRGSNGAGKSTLAKVLSGLFQPWSGVVRFNDVTVKPYRNPGRLVTYNHQYPDSSFFERTVRSEVEAGAVARGFSGLTLSNHVDSALQAFGLYHLGDSEIYDLPFAVRKRVSLAATVATSAPWMIFDEPTLGQDDEACEKIASLFRNLSAVGTGVIVVSHSPRFISLLSAREHLLHNGAFISAST